MKIIGIYNAVGINNQSWLEKVAAHIDNVEFEIIDNDNYTAQNFGITRCPTILVVNNANIVRGKLEGKYTVEKAVEWINNAL